jgi:hypothetical protein
LLHRNNGTLTEYLLRLRIEDDKSEFLALAGYTQDNADLLLRDIQQILPLEADCFERTEYGPNGRALRVVTMWMKDDATNPTKFVTLFPDKL